jgi:formiminotetrahydrofolate cyclodeaminase
MAAALVSMAARGSDEWVEAPGIAAQAQALRARLVVLLGTAVAAYEEALDALARGDEAGPSRDADLGRALTHAADAPLAVADAAADVAELAAEAAQRAAPPLQPDAAAAAMLADAATRASVRLFSVNLAAATSEERRERARRAEHVAAAAARRAAAEVR